MNPDTSLQEERSKTIENMSTDIFKLESALESVKDLTPEGEIIREDLLGLLHFGSDSYHQVDSLMIERRKMERWQKHSSSQDGEDTTTKRVLQ